PVRQYTAQSVSEPTTLQVHRGADGRFALYEDDGKSLDYLRGQGSWTQITWDDGKSRLVIEPDARSAARVPSERTFEIAIFPDKAGQRVKYAGKRVEVELGHPKSVVPKVTAPPEAFFASVREPDREAARKFYKKYVDVQGMPVVASADVADEALGRTHY